MINPGFVFFVFAILMCFVGKKLRNFLSLVLIGVSILTFINMPQEISLKFLDFEIIFKKTDLNTAFYYVFIIIAISGFIYSFSASKLDFVVATIYSGSAVSLIFSYDMISFFIFWELMAIASTFLIFLGGYKYSKNAALRYALIHIMGGSLLISGIALNENVLILISFLINLAAVPFNAWLTDSYPESSVYGGVFLSAYTTKSAVYAIARFFPGSEVLIYIGAVMSVYGVVYAVVENDLRRVLSYHIISQVGYMVCGVGLGTISGATSHAFTHIIYKGLLFMSAGAVLYSTGVRKLTQLGGLLKELPVALFFLLIGGLSITGFPLFSGFVSKTIIIHESEKIPFVYYMLEFASIGTCLTFTKLPFYIFFGEKKLLEIKKIPFSMILGMSIASIFSIVIGLFPKSFYKYMPGDIDFYPYTLSYMIETLAFYFGVIISFFVFKKLIKSEDKITLDTDWVYRKFPKYFGGVLNLIRDSIRLFKRFIFENIPNELNNAANYLYKNFKETEIARAVSYILIILVTFFALLI
ncbi:MAG: Na+/H+ antiporter subunit D [bacterium]|nr:Na+/H+ antiporter subunit D [bacterium]